MDDHTSDWLLDAMIECANHTFEHNSDLYEQLQQQDRESARVSNRTAQRRYRQENAEHVRQRNTLGNRNVIKELLIEQDYHCGYCGITLYGDGAIDHIIPLSRGGSSDVENLVACCKDCNHRKFTLTPDEWRAKRRW